MPNPAPERARIKRGPLIKEVATAAGVATATVDRVLNGRGPVAQDTRLKVLEALVALQVPRAERPPRVAFLCESGESFNRSLEDALATAALRRQDLDLTIRTFSSFDVHMLAFAQAIEREADNADAIVVVARADPLVMRATRAVMRRGKPVVCLATDLPVSCRNGFIGSDERSGGAAAAELLGALIQKPVGSLLLIVCGHYHAAQDREQGFATVLRERFPHLAIAQRSEVDNDPALVHGVVQGFVAERGAPDAIYSLAGGNTGVGRALAECGLDQSVVFLGHELNANSRALLRSGTMSFLITRDQEHEVMLALTMIDALLAGRPHRDREETRIRIVTRQTCD